MLAAIVVGLLVATLGVSTVGIDGASMQPTLFSGERGLALRYEAWLHRIGIGAFQVGDVVFFKIPAPPRWPPGLAVKRIVAVSADTVELIDGVVLVNGVPRSESYVSSSLSGSESAAAQAVPEGHVYVLGDNRAPLQSLDSRRFGPIPVSSIAGRVTAVLWPFWRTTDQGRIRNVRLLMPPSAGQPTVEP